MASRKFKPRIPERAKAAAPVEKVEPSSGPMDWEDDKLDVKVKMEDGAVVWDCPAEQEIKPEQPDAANDVKGLDVKDLVENQVAFQNQVKHEAIKEEVQPISKHEFDGGDGVVREIDVHITPSIDQDTKLYLLQYPLRPYWRPYGLEERCQEVRVKPEHNKLEVDLVVDDFGENYDEDAESHLKIKKMTLTSTPGNLSTNYAIGILQGNKLHLNPLHAIVQLRPSLKYLDEAAEAEKKNIRHVESDEEVEEAADEEATESKPQAVAFKVQVKKTETEKQQQTRLTSYAYLKQLEDAEPWNTLEPYGYDSPLTESIKRKIKGCSSTPVPFPMKPSDYLKALVPGRPAAPSSITSKEPLSKSYLDTLPLDKRLQAVLSQGRVQVLQFERLMKLAPTGCKEEEVLEILQKISFLVQGCWVAASSLRYSGPICRIRDYILCLFVKNRVIDREVLDELSLPKEVLREVLHPLAVQNLKTGAWEFIESTDKTFIKRHNLIFRDQMQKWTQNEAAIKAGAFSVQSAGLGVGTRVKLAGVAAGAAATATPLGKRPASMAPETIAALPGALRDIFKEHQVCNLQFIRSCLENLAITKSQGDCDFREKAAAVAAAKAPIEELTSVVDEIADNVNGVYFLRDIGDATLQPLRELVIAFLKLKGGSGLQKSEIMTAAKELYKNKLPSQTVVNKVLREFCYTKGATWVLKTGDGRPL